MDKEARGKKERGRESDGERGIGERGERGKERVEEERKEERKSPVLAPVLIQLMGCPGSREASPRLGGNAFLETGFSCPGERFLVFYAN